MYTDEEIVLCIDAFLRHGLAISPWLAGMRDDQRFDADVDCLLESAIMDFSAKYWTEEEKIKAFGTLPIPERIARTAVYEIATSTAYSLAFELAESIQVDENIVRLALDQMVKYVESYSFSYLVIAYSYVTSYENHQALFYYERIPENVFVKGCWHRPWVKYTLSDELIFGMHLGYYQLAIEDGTRYVELTPQGHEFLKNTKRMLENSGFLAHRIKQLQISHFNSHENYDDDANRIWPNVNLLRVSFINWARVSPGLRVLELGCADGVLAFDGGLAERIGKRGLLIGIDPSSAMIARAERRLHTQPFEWVHFHKARAEEMPFLDASFDLVVGIGVWHFLQVEEALREIFRVLKPGGTFASFHPTVTSFAEAPFFKEWFSPLLQLANARQEADPLNYLPVYEQVLQALEHAGFTSIQADRRLLENRFVEANLVIDHLILGVGWFQEELSLLPWRAREEMIERLRKRGVAVCAKYPESERIVNAQIQFVKCNRPK